MNSLRLLLQRRQTSQVFPMPKFTKIAKELANPECIEAPLPCGLQWSAPLLLAGLLPALILLAFIHLAFYIQLFPSTSFPTSNFSYFQLFTSSCSFFQLFLLLAFTFQLSTLSFSYFKLFLLLAHPTSSFSNFQPKISSFPTSNFAYIQLFLL